MVEKYEYIKWEYQTLRKEIEECKSRILRLTAVGLIGTPSVYFLADAYKIEFLIFSLPILICIVLLLFLSERHAIMRCGRYIRTIIEQEVEEHKGWEAWLEETERGEPNRRFVDKLVTLSFYLLFGLYYIASVSLAGTLAQSKYDNVGYILYSFYTALGVALGCFLYKCWKDSTSTI
jgi:hypothetical protein